MSTSEKAAELIVKAMRMLNKQPPDQRQLLCMDRRHYGRFEQWSDADKDYATQQVLRYQDDVQGWYSDALSDLSPDEWKQIGANLLDGNEQHTGKLIHNAIRRTYAELMATIVDEA